MVDAFSSSKLLSHLLFSFVFTVRLKVLCHLYEERATTPEVENEAQSKTDEMETLVHLPMSMPYSNLPSEVLKRIGLDSSDSTPEKCK